LKQELIEMSDKPNKTDISNEPMAQHSGFIRRAEHLNKQRVNKMLKLNKRNKLTGLLVTTFVGSICMTFLLLLLLFLNSLIS